MNGMLDLGRVLAVARAEVRLTRRLVRYWVFLAMAFVFGLGLYLYYGVLHAFFSSYSATAASIGPRYLVGAFGFNYLVFFVVGIIFLAFDLRARDRRERMLEVLDSRPLTNLDLVGGRFLGLLAAAWVPVLVLVVVLVALGWLLPLIGSPVGEPVEPMSLLTFAFFMALPAFAFAIALTFLVTLLVRNRVVAAVILLALLGLDTWAVVRLPLKLGPLFDFYGAYVVNFPSEIVPTVSDLVGWLQRPGILLTALGMVVVAAAVHPRLDGGSRLRTALPGLVLLALAGGLIWTGLDMRFDDLKAIARWRQAHEARADEPVVDLESVKARVRVEPGRALAIETELTVRAPAGPPLESLLFTLNPGQNVVSARDETGAELVVSHQDGLLEVRLAKGLAPGTATTLHLAIEGIPDRRFGYLDSARTLEDLDASYGALFLLGFERSIFDRRYVALMPAARWLPMPGADVARDDPRRRSPDFFSVELEVEVPRGWLVAGPGRRREATGAPDRATFRFAPGAPLPEVALIASRFELRGVEIEGVYTEVLLHRKHLRNLEVLADAGGEIRGWVAGRLREAAEVGLGYPYEALTLVEVPNSLRGFGGGWRMDTALAPPTLLLVREMSFPTARFDVPFRDPDDFRDREGGLPRAKLERVQAYFVNDFSGGNVFTGAARNFLMYQVAAVGPEGLGLNYVLESLSTLLVTGTRGYFSAHIFSPRLNKRIQAAIFAYLTSQRAGRTVADAVIETFTSRPEVWDATLGVSLVDLDPWQDPARTVDVLTLKGDAVARSLLDGLGRERTGRLLAALRQSHQGRAIGLAELVAAGDTVGASLEDLLGDWLHGTALPGLVAEEGRAFRLADAEDGSPRYQLLVTVRNDEPVPGLFRVVSYVGSGEERERVASDPLRIAGRAALRYGAVFSQPPQQALVEPYLSLNREAFLAPMQPVGEGEIVNAEAIVGASAVEWSPGPPDVVTVDDLDQAFVVDDGGARGGLRIGRRSDDDETDQGLPLQAFGFPPARWSRLQSASAWGRYRHTTAAVRVGKGSRSATFAAALPRPGSWDLELHLPAKERFQAVRKWGTWNLKIVEGSGEQQVQFDSAAAAQGWNLVGSYQLAAGEVKVVLSDKADGQVVVADAIRWTPAATAVVVEEPS